MDRDLIDYFIDKTDERFDRLDEKVDRLLEFKWKSVGALAAFNVIMFAAMQIFFGH